MRIRPTKQHFEREYLHRFQHRAVRDLAWSLTTPALFKSIPHFPADWLRQDLTDDELWPWLDSIDKQPQLLYTHLHKQRSTRLGIYFEQLLSFYFEYFPRFTLVAKNLQVNGDKRTLGEFDFIVEDHRDRNFKHIEAAVKFYLGHLNYQGEINNNIPHYNWHNWVGPNQKDTLSIKMQHLQKRQLPLSRTLHGQATLTKLGLPDDIHSRLFVKGRFYFYPKKKIEAPSFSNKELCRYHWFETDTLFFTDSILDDNKKYCILPRSFWLSELRLIDIESNDIAILTKSELQLEIKTNMLEDYNEWKISELDMNDRNNTEVKRFFIVNSQNLPSDE